MSNHLLDDSRVHDWLRTLDENPGSAQHALVFSDWLEENGYPAHAEMIRLHHSPLGGGKQDPGGYKYTGYSGGGYRYEDGKTEANIMHQYNSLGVNFPIPGSNKRLNFHVNTMPVKGAAAHLHKALVEEGATPREFS